jgi:O-antigen/teichoic acid export membrane protein
LQFSLRNIYQRLTSSEHSLSKQVYKSGFWVGAIKIVSRLFSFTRTIILARLLAPEDFGLFGIAMLALSTIESFSKTGFSQALIQKKEDIDNYLDAAWTIEILRGCFLAIILYFSAPFIGDFFNENRAVLLVKALSIAVLLNSFKNIGVVYFEKDLEFHKQFVYKIVSTFADLVVAVVAAYIFRSAWALVLGLVAGNLSILVLSYVIHPYRPKINFDLNKIKELYDFGKFIFLQGIVIFLITQGDDVFVGKALGASALGLYQISYRISNMAATEITSTISQVTFPAFSKIQQNKEKLFVALKRTLELVSLITIPISVVLVIFANPIVNIVLGEKWLEAAPLIQILSVFGLIRSLGASLGPAYKALAKVNLPLRFNFIQLLILVTFIYPASNMHGIIGVSFVVSLSALPVLFMSIFFMSDLLEKSKMDFIKPFQAPMLSSALMGIALGPILYFFEISSFIVLISLLILSAILYILFILLFVEKYRILIQEYILKRNK